MGRNDRSPRPRLWRLGLAMAVALVGSVVSLRTFDRRPPPVCPVDAAQDPAYTARLEPAALAGVHDYVVSVSHAEAPLTVGVCLRIAMTGMPEMAVIGWPRRVDADYQQVRLNFEMAGAWQGTLMVLRPGDAPVAVPLSLEVT